MEILSINRKGGKSPVSLFGDRIEKLRKDIIDAIRQLLHAHCMKEIRLPEEDYDPVWVIWLARTENHMKCRVDTDVPGRRQPDRPCRRERKR